MSRKSTDEEFFRKMAKDSEYLQRLMWFARMHGDEKLQEITEEYGRGTTFLSAVKDAWKSKEESGLKL